MRSTHYNSPTEERLPIAPLQLPKFDRGALRNDDVKPLVLRSSGRGAGAGAGTAADRQLVAARSAGGASLGGGARLLVLHPAVAARARVAFVGTRAAVLATDAGADARLRELEVLDGVLDFADELGHGLCGGSGDGGGWRWSSKDLVLLCLGSVRGSVRCKDESVGVVRCCLE